MHETWTPAGKNAMEKMRRKMRMKETIDAMRKKKNENSAHKARKNDSKAQVISKFANAYKRMKTIT